MGITRGVSTLVGAAVAGFLIWLAAQLGTGSSGEYWATYGVIAAAGLTIALSQILGGWTKGGWPRISPGVLLLGFLPVLVVGGWVLLARQPADFFNTSNWSRDLGIMGVVSDLGEMLAAVAFGVGLTFGLTFDTSGPRREAVARRRAHEAPRTAPAPVERTRDRDADEPLTAEREAAMASADESDGHERGRRFGLRRVGSGSKRHES
jgi:signal transduction histidine kinase